jgi:hypothetical protein
MWGQLSGRRSVRRHASRQGVDPSSTEALAHPAWGLRPACDRVFSNRGSPTATTEAPAAVRRVPQRVRVLRVRVGAVLAARATRVQQPGVGRSPQADGIDRSPPMVNPDHASHRRDRRHAELPQQIECWNPNSCGESLDGPQCQVPFAALDTAHVRAVDAQELRKGFLTEPLLLAEGSQVPAECRLQVTFHLRVNGGVLLLIGLHTDE